MKTFIVSSLLLFSFYIHSSENYKIDFEKECSNDEIVGQVGEYFSDENHSKIVFTKRGVKLVSDCNAEDK